MLRCCLGAYGRPNRAWMPSLGAGLIRLSQLLTAASQPADPDDDAREDQRRASALVSAWLEKPHKINTALNMHQYATFEPVQDTSSQVYGPRHLLEPASRRSPGSPGSPAS